MDSDPAARLWPWLAKHNGIRIDKVKTEKISAAVREPLLSAGQVDVVTGSSAVQRLSDGWDRFVEPGLGVRCVDDQPWVTGGETAELALTLAVRGDSRAAQLLADIERLRHTDGSYWTGYQFANQVIWPRERTTWTAGAVLLAMAAQRDDPPTHAVFTPFSLAVQGKPRYPIE